MTLVNISDVNISDVNVSDGGDNMRSCYSNSNQKSFSTNI